MIGKGQIHEEQKQPAHGSISLVSRSLIDPLVPNSCETGLVMSEQTWNISFIFALNIFFFDWIHLTAIPHRLLELQVRSKSNKKGKKRLQSGIIRI